MSAGAGLADFWNPILVKEVRAALRGRVFRVLFPIVVIGSVLVGLLQLGNVDWSGAEAAGRRFFTPIYVLMSIALLGIVPLSAFFALAREWEEHTFDLLAISDLRPRRIVAGKLFSAGVEGLLYFSAFAPLLVFAFLLRGIDVEALLWLLGLTLLASIAMSALALALSSLARGRVLRIFLLVVLSAGAVGVVTLAFNLAEYFVLRRFGRPRGFGSEELWISFLVVAGALFTGTTIACERLAHPEENHSTGPRILITTLLVTWIVAFCVILGSGGGSRGDLSEALMIGGLLASFAHVFFLTEREDLSRRTARHVPRNALLAFLATPFLPGGGRAVLLCALHAALPLVASWIVDRGPTAGGPLSAAATSEALFETLRTMSFLGLLFVVPGLVSWCVHRKAAEFAVRWIARVAIPLLVILAVLVPAFWIFLVLGHRQPEFDHPFNPFVLFERRGAGSYPWIGGALLAVGTVVLLNLGRVARGILEVQGASRRRREREKVGA